MSPTSEFSTNLISSLHETLTDLNRHPYPNVPSPETCKKRASVALVLRVRPDFRHWPPQNPSAPESNLTTSPIELIDNFFDQEWVRNGDPEIVFIKRAARGGDRWSSHSAFPGGKRDPEDENDKEVAIRETSEEIGLDLKSPSALYIGNLPERVVSTSWGKVPIMVLCPFVFLWTQPDIPPFKLQPTEVASTHWVPLRVLLSPSTRTFEYVDVSDRFARRGGKIMKLLLRPVLGKMSFSAIRLLPSETLRCTSTAEYFSEPAQSVDRTWGSWLFNWYKGGTNNTPLTEEKPLLLWGLTLGMLADLLEQLPPHNAIELWSHPTFTSLDARWIVGLLTRSLKARNVARLGSNSTVVDSETEAVGSGEESWFVGEPANGKPLRKGNNKTQTYAVGVMLDGYYDLMRRGVWIAATTRILASAFFIVYIVRRFTRYRS